MTSACLKLPPAMHCEPTLQPALKAEEVAPSMVAACTICGSAQNDENAGQQHDHRLPHRCLCRKHFTFRTVQAVNDDPRTLVCRQLACLACRCCLLLNCRCQGGGYASTEAKAAGLRCDPYLLPSPSAAALPGIPD